MTYTFKVLCRKCKKRLTVETFDLVTELPDICFDCTDKLYGDVKDEICRN